MQLESESKKTEQTDQGAVGFVLVVFAAVLVTLAIYAVGRVIDVRDDALARMSQESEVVRNIGLFLLGVIGLPLAIWRSWIAKQQVDEAVAQGRRTERQLLHAEKQLQSTETTALLGVIEKAGGLLADESLNARRAGIYLLDSVMAKREVSLSSAAAELIYQFVRENGRTDSTDHYLACMALLKFSNEIAIHDHQDYRDMALKKKMHLHVDNGTIERLIINMSEVYFYNCIIDECFIVSEGVHIEGCDVTNTLMLDARNTLSGTTFKSCDFSYSRIATLGDDCKFDECYYYEETPPSPECLAAFSSKLEVRPGRSPHFNDIDQAPEH